MARLIEREIIVPQEMYSTIDVDKYVVVLGSQSPFITIDDLINDCEEEYREKPLNVKIYLDGDNSYLSINDKMVLENVSEEEIRRMSLQETIKNICID